MWNYTWLILFKIVFLCLITVSYNRTLPRTRFKKYCIVGAGPGGLQMGTFLNAKKRDYVIFERNSGPGSFFEKYPRHDTLISSNKRFTGRDNTEFNLRHDWNSLLSENHSFRFTRYSQSYFPSRFEYLKYLKDFERYEDIQVQYNHEVTKIVRLSNSYFRLYLSTGYEYVCQIVLIGTGLDVPVNHVEENGENLSTGYEEFSMNDVDSYIDKNVAIIGAGNSAFEVANSIVDAVRNLIIISKSIVRMAYDSHYVGNARAVNLGILDNFKLGMLTGIITVPGSGVTKLEAVHHPDGSIYIPQIKNVGTSREPYFHKVIRCTGFQFNWSIFDGLINIIENRSSRYPNMNLDYSMKGFSNIFFIGAVSHSADYKMSSGGFIHGFRYTARSLHRMIEWKFERVKWSSDVRPISELIDHMITRINENSGLYQMYNVMCDVYVINDACSNYVLVEEFPVLLLPNFTDYTGIQITGEIIVMRFQYHWMYNSFKIDTLSFNRVRGIKPRSAHKSNFLHPVLFHYYDLEAQSTENLSIYHLWDPVSIHHISEDAKTEFFDLDFDVEPLYDYFASVLSFNFLVPTLMECLIRELTIESHSTCDYYSY